MSGVRRAERTKKRLPCTLVIDGNRVPGIVLDLSATGFFVQTSANPPSGAELRLELEVPGEPQRPLLAVRVARRKVVPPRLKSVVHAGLGLQIESAPEVFFRYLAQLQPVKEAGGSPAVAEPSAKPASAATAPPAKPAPARRRGARRGASPPPRAAARKERFRVRVSQVGGSRSRSLEVSAASEEEARRQAMAASGEGWRILACERLG